MHNTKSITVCRMQSDDEMHAVYMRNLTWVVTILFVMSAAADSSTRFASTLMLAENEQVAMYGAVLGLAVWPKLKKRFGV